MIKKILLAIALLAPLSAVAQKIATFDYFSILQSMKEYETATAQLTEIGNKYQAELEEMQKELQTKSQKYESEVNESTPANVRQRKEQELQDMYQKLQQASQDNQQAFQQKQQELMAPIASRLQEAANQVAKEGNYLFLIDVTAAQSNYIFVNKSTADDVTKQVMAKVGVTTLKPVQQPAQ